VTLSRGDLGGEVNQTGCGGVMGCMGIKQNRVRPWELPPSFDDFVTAGSPGLLRIAYLLTGDRGAAEDLLQVALVRVARRWDSAREAPDAYAHRVLVNLSHDRRRRLHRRVREAPLVKGDEQRPLPGDVAQEVVDRSAVISVIQGLPARQREVVVLRFFADLSVSETATAIGASQGTVKTHTHRALAALREVLTDQPSIPAKGQSLC
jgi:RNA polymerase sigma-70 factor (sigma-E family)